ncbi:hypothetical protein KC19_VG123500 [Ceratodon purpureus]|uniref:Uncharacterized protein n=1 Tax=Ceratodon purpureus TaxID=3225 RepID=A0A8T0HPP7_CERPU|nr:hypothetical protein KC19_VG123500 [Ceratodon purpureus]
MFLLLLSTVRADWTRDWHSSVGGRCLSTLLPRLSCQCSCPFVIRAELTLLTKYYVSMKPFSI